MVAGKSPGWLPAGWKEQVKVTNGRKVKCYVEQLTGSKFYSKPQVSEYLKNKKPSMGELFGGNTSLKLEASDNTSSLEMSTLEGVSCLSKQKQIGVSKQSMKKVVIERTIPDGLPTGWIKETKIQKISGRKDPYYTDPVSGYVFRSVPDALRFLESGNINKCAIKPRKRDELIFLNEETSGEPPSAANMDHSGHHETKRQLEGSENSVTNKVIGKRQCPTVSADATILSTAEHLLNNATEECAETECSNDPTRSPLPRTEGSKRKLRDGVKANNGTDQLAVNAVGITSEQKMLIESTKTEKQGISLPCRSSKRLMVTNLELSERDLRAAARNAGGNEAKLLVCSAPQKLKTLSKAEIANHVSTGTEAPLDAKQSNRTNNPLKKEAFSEDWPARQGVEEEDEGNVESKILNPVGDSWSDPCLDFAVKILTGTIQIEEDTKESNHPGSSQLTRNDGCIRNQCEMVCAENGTVSFPSADMVQAGVLAENGMGMTRSRKMQINSGRSKKKEAVNLPRRSSIRLAGLNSNMAINLPLCQHVPASTKSGESGAVKPPPEALDNMAHSPQFFEPIEGSKKHMEDQAVQEHQPDRQETEKKPEGNPRSQFLYPLEDSWPDSCIEFAVKTLTGEIPIEDNTAIQDFFRQHDDTSHTLPDLGLPNYFQSDILLDFDSTGNPVSGTQLPEIPTFLSPGNVDLTGCGDSAPQQPSLGEKGEQQQTKGNS